MSQKIFVNLAVADLPRAKEFFGKLGFTFNPQFTTTAAACMIISADIYAMLLTHERFRDFTPKAVVDAKRSTEVLIALTRDSRAEVDQLMNAALAAGARETRPVQDHGFMYGRSFDDLDGHIWEIFWMDPAAVQ